METETATGAESSQFSISASHSPASTVSGFARIMGVITVVNLRSGDTSEITTQVAGHYWSSAHPTFVKGR